MCCEIAWRAGRQEPFNNIRRSRWAVIRATYPRLADTTMVTWSEWIDPVVAPIKRTVPITCEWKDILADGTELHLTVLFIAIDSIDDVGKLKSLELTGAWINEASEIDKSTLDMLQLCVGRYPPKRDGGPSWSGVIMDTNPPADDHWWFHLAEVVKPKGFRFWQQPGALIREPDGTYSINPDAENVKHQPLGYDYWRRALEGKDQNWINAYILGQYDHVWSGKPVYDAIFSEDRHVAKRPLGVYGGLPLYAGFDFGLSPACVLAQLSPVGQLRILREYIGEDIGLREFLGQIVRPALLNEFRGMQVSCCADPAGAQRSQVDEMTCIAELIRQGIPTQPAPTNDFGIRRQSVVSYLSRNVGEDSGFLIDPSCRTLIAAMTGGYQLARVQSRSGEQLEIRYHDQPIKNHWSHVAEACQYLCCGLEHSALGLSRRGKAWPERAGWG